MSGADSDSCPLIRVRATKFECRPCPTSQTVPAVNVIPSATDHKISARDRALREARLERPYGGAGPLIDLELYGNRWRRFNN
jgi:hypothetical protein